MSIQGTVEKIGEDWFVRYQDTMFNEPTLLITRWKITNVQGWIKEGIKLEWNGNNYAWHGYSHTQGYTEIYAERQGTTEQVPVPCPKVRKGIETRWKNGRWQKRLKTGWIST